MQWSLVPGTLVLVSLINVFFCDNDKIPAMVPAMVYNSAPSFSGVLADVLYSLLFEN